MNTTKRNPKKDPREGDWIWRPAGRGWNSVIVQRVADELVDYELGGATHTVPLEDWREHTMGWRLHRPMPRHRAPRHELYPESYFFARGAMSGFKSAERNA